MYGSLITYRPKPEVRDGFTALAKDWVTRRGADVGLVAEYALEPDDQTDTVIVLAVFASRDAYKANAVDPAMDAEYRNLRTMLVEDPTYVDGAISAIESNVVPL